MGAKEPKKIVDGHRRKCLQRAMRRNGGRYWATCCRPGKLRSPLWRIRGNANSGGRVGGRASPRRVAIDFCVTVGRTWRDGFAASPDLRLDRLGTRRQFRVFYGRGDWTRYDSPTRHHDEDARWSYQKDSVEYQP